MKTYVFFFIACAVLIVGSALADPGIPKVNEVQGLSTSTTVIAAGNFNSASSVDILASTGVPLTSIPGPVWSNGKIGAAIYQSVNTEDTQNSEVGFISYDKDLDVSTANKVSGQYNIQAVKQITYLGVDASSMITNDYLLLDGAGWPGNAGLKMICPFTGNLAYGAFCNRVETGSTMNLKVANLNTQMGDRFVMKAADPGVEVFNNVGVGSYAENLTSRGSVSAFIRGSIKEAGRGRDETPNQVLDNPFGVVGALYETATFSDTTAISGDISSFAKQMSYKSVIDTSGDIPLVS